VAARGLVLLLGSHTSVDRVREGRKNEKRQFVRSFAHDGTLMYGSDLPLSTTA